MLRPSCLTASSIPQSGSTACSISATPFSPKNPPMDDRLCLRSPPPQQTRCEPPELGAALQLEALDPECTYPSAQNGHIPPNPEKGNGNPNSQIHTAKSKSRQIRTNQTFPSFPGCRALSHLTNSRPTLPLVERTHVKRFIGSRRGQSRHLVIGNAEPDLRGIFMCGGAVSGAVAALR